MKKNEAKLPQHLANTLRLTYELVFPESCCILVGTILDSNARRRKGPKWKFKNCNSKSIVITYLCKKVYP